MYHVSKRHASHKERGYEAGMHVLDGLQLQDVHAGALPHGAPHDAHRGVHHELELAADGQPILGFKTAPRGAD